MLDIVFSLDSVITAVGMSQHLPVMVTAVLISVAVMLLAAKPIGDFINRHPTVKMLALSFLLLVGVALIADGLHFHIPRGYLYFAIAFSALVECLNLVAAAHAHGAARRGPGERGRALGLQDPDRVPKVPQKWIGNWPEDASALGLRRARFVGEPLEKST